MTIKLDENNENNEVPEMRDTMADDYRDPQFNTYDSGPGAELPSELQPAVLASQTDLTNRKDCGLYLRNVPKEINEAGIKNLCGKYGQMKTLKRYPYGHYVVIFSSTEDASNCLREINEGPTGIRASFKTDKKEESSLESSENNVAKFMELPDCPEGILKNIPNELTAPMSVSSFKTQSLLPVDAEHVKDIEESDPLIEFYNQIENNRLLTVELQRNQITNGRANYKRSNEISAAELPQSRGILNKAKQEFVYNDIDMFGEIGDCKHCGNPTLTFCKGCKDFFCSTYCCKEYKKINLNCSCSSPSSMKIEKLPLRNHESAIGRGGKIKISRSTASKLNLSMSSTESESDVISPSKGRKRLEMLRKSSVGMEAMLSRKEMTPKRCEIPSNNKQVVITSVVDHRTVYLRSTESKDNERYLKFLNDVAENSKTAATLQQIPKKGDIVLAEFEGGYYRAMVARIMGDFVVVAFFEFGNLEKKSLDQLKEMRDDLQRVQRFTFKAHLKDVVADLKSDQCLVYLYELIEGCVPLNFLKSDSIYAQDSMGVLCELLVSSTNDSVNVKIDRLNNIKVDEKMNVDVAVLVETLEGEDLAVTVLDNATIKEGYITVTKCEHMELIARMQERIAEYCKNEYEGPHTPPEEYVCLGKCGDDWYRTVMAKSFGDGNPLVMFLDFGNKNRVNIHDMRRMPMEFKYPYYSIYVKVAGIPSNPTEEELAKLKEFLAPGNQLRGVRIKETDKPIIYIKDLKV